MAPRPFPTLDDPALPGTRDALHAYARVLGGWLTACRLPRKHWWQGSLRPSARGLTTGVLYSETAYELELDLVASQLRVRTSDEEWVEPLHGQAATELAERTRAFLTASGVDERCLPEGDAKTDSQPHTETYSADCARAVVAAWSAVTAALEELRAGIREEASPIQLWPHHFDLSMVWLPGGKVPGHDPHSIEHAEHADTQMNFGFTLGDGTIAEPYFYITAYPSPDGFPSVSLPEGARWQTEGFSGVTLTYRRLCASSDPHRFLLDLWGDLVSVGRDHLRA